ncbi:hypothetical protein AAFF_G00008830 [Aldrovandia affinis]|uniref:Uncharacterized protein n=1 Tax=Aldrovandia affinis TaxID=143900 RepID=A0AAD7WZX2_9TELE|nr:hypothetical protein AAFF_G00008830 [Aldrovandia affinis]
MSEDEPLRGASEEAEESLTQTAGEESKKRRCVTAEVPRSNYCAQSPDYPLNQGPPAAFFIQLRSRFHYHTSPMHPLPISLLLDLI